MGLFPKDEPGQAVFFSPGKIAAVRAHQEQLAARKQQEQRDKEHQRQAKAAERERKAQEAQKRRETRQREAAEKRALREQEKEARRRQKEAEEWSRVERRASGHVLNLSAQAPKRKAMDTEGVEAKRVKTGMPRSRGSIALPKRFQG